MQIFTPAALTLSDDVAKFTVDANHPVAVADIRKLAAVVANTPAALRAFNGIIKAIKTERSRILGTIEIPGNGTTA